MNHSEQDLLFNEVIRCLASEQFLMDVKLGLSAKEKHLSSKYLYDKTGDALFQEIMQIPEYYLTRCELDIFQNKTLEVANAIGDESFDLIELGAGDGSKSVHLLKHLSEKQVDFNFYPIDISANILQVLEGDLKEKISNLSIEGLEGEYFDMLTVAVKKSSRRKVVMMLGANIGNMGLEEARAFCATLRQNLAPGDLVLIGFDLRKNPRIILDAYNDGSGITAAFNLNLLKRINRELYADFDPEGFEHYQTYDPQSGEYKSFLVSLKSQQVTLDRAIIGFEKNEVIFMEVSRKFTVSEIYELAIQSGFVVRNFINDSREWFSDVVWQVA
ncbi:L-histidine N(alpha)-methyltransferase [Pedobacter nototheniae]|uniref:L-histidine N(alpha)-methyltransferase n=1 Tax=Pedobacter nototheniae TaxID=2488994 RepID=UPI00103C3E35|nr:L-histidine N(alpha)-methyltransferase [Pedobacter nototheniae]